MPSNNGNLKHSSDEYKDQFEASYDVAARNVELRRPLFVARILQKRLGYTAQELDVIGQDVRTMQGTGNPHKLAKIKAGETVLDLGSGLGADAFLAAHSVGQDGRVFGLDLSQEHVSQAQHRAEERGVGNIVRFVRGDMEHIPLPDSSVDCVISNGGFCLVPNKPLAFQEVSRVLKPGGRMSIACTTLRQPLPSPDTHGPWPACMEVFLPLPSVNAVVQAAGFSSALVDLSDASMDKWDMSDDELVTEIARDDSGEEFACSHARKAAERRARAKLDAAVAAREEAEARLLAAQGEGLQPADAAERQENLGLIHWGDPEYQHLEQYDMNSLCARVVIYAEKQQQHQQQQQTPQTTSNLSSPSLQPSFKSASASAAVDESSSFSYLQDNLATCGSSSRRDQGTNSHLLGFGAAFCCAAAAASISSRRRRLRAAASSKVYGRFVTAFSRLFRKL